MEFFHKPRRQSVLLKGKSLRTVFKTLSMINELEKDNHARKLHEMRRYASHAGWKIIANQRAEMCVVKNE